MTLEDYVPILLTPVCSDFKALPKSRFTWKQVTLQNRWGFSVYPNDQQIVNAMIMAGKLESIARFLYPMKVEYNIHSWLRCRPYNVFIGGAKESAHLDAAAVDFSITGADCYVITQRLKSELQRLEIRMEDLGENAVWCHADIKPAVNGVRLFKP